MTRGFRIATFNIKHAEVRGLDAVTEALRDADADAVALQEVDVGTLRSLGVDQARELGERLGMTHVFAPAFALGGGHYGVALLGREPLAGAVIPLPRLDPPRDEPRVALAARLADAWFVTTHFSLDPEERLAQARSLAARFHEPPAVLLGDFNESVSGDAVRALLAVGLRDAWADCGAAEAVTSAPDRPRERVDLVLLGPSSPRAASVELRERGASDHPLVLVTLAS